MMEACILGGTSMDYSWLHGALGLGADETPFPWQEAVVARFLKGEVEGVADIPTGLGKTAVMAAWLVARGLGAPVPRRLVYVVDRRAVVDQATEFAIKLQAYVESNGDLKTALGLGRRRLPISTLRGQFADNREWLADPACPAIIVGTVDMIGSRLLFEGYGVSRKMRPYHAGMLGVDTLLVLDEAHLVPPFEHLIEAVASNSALQPDASSKTNARTIKLLSLSATGRRRTTDPITLTPADFENTIVQRRLNAEKRLTTIELGDDALHDVLVREARRLAVEGLGANRVIVFCNSREIAKKVFDGIRKHVDHAELLVGERRVHERMQVAQWMREHGFLAGIEQPRNGPAVLVATSAGEVGVDLDADHMVSDLVAWERMVQRFGRVNRRGSGSAQVVVVVQSNMDRKTKKVLEKPEAERSDKDRDLIMRHERAVAQSRALGLLQGDASPRALLELRGRADERVRQIIAAAITPAPLRPALTRPIVDSWSMTSIRDDPGRPTITPWLRGWVDDEYQTSVVWRTHLPGGERPARAEQEAYFEAAAPRLEEYLEAPTYRVADWLVDRVHAIRGLPADERVIADDELAAVVLSPAGELVRTYAARDLDIDAVEDKRYAKRMGDELRRSLREKILVIDARLGGLADGLLDPKHALAPGTADAQVWKGIEFKVQRVTGDPEAWRESFRFVLAWDANGEPREWLTVANATTEERRGIASHPQLLDEHQEWARDQAVCIAKLLALPEPLKHVITIAARLHDEGKRASRWQRAFRADAIKGYQRDRPYAKTRGPLNVALLDGYRHELGSLPYAERDPEVAALPEDDRDLVLHLIAAHHGHARPVITERGCDDALPMVVRERTREVARRFLRLQERWGPWVLAWLEALVRSADQLASKANDEKDA